MNSLEEIFELTPEILEGMDDSHAIADMVTSLVVSLEDSGARAGNGVDYAIACAITHAEDDGNPAFGVLDNLKFQVEQLSILIRNLEALPRWPQVTNK